jgi:hypothetical protein
MSVEKLKACLTLQPLAFTPESLKALQLQDLPDDMLEKLEPILNEDLLPRQFASALAKLLTPEELARYGPAITKASTSTYVAVPAGVWADACVELGPEHHGEDTAGSIAKQVAKKGIQVPMPGMVQGEVKIIRKGANRVMRFHRDNHLQPLLDAIAKREASQPAKSA